MIDTVVNVIIATLGRFHDGAAYTTVIGSTFIGVLPESGAGDVAATSVFTIPAMKKSDMLAHLAANIESTCSTMGDKISPAGVITTDLACCNEFSGAEMFQSTFWFACWGVMIWFIH